MILSLAELYGQSRLFQDYITNFEKLAPFFSGDYRDEKAYAGLAEQVLQVPRPHREQLAAILTEQNTSYGCSAATLANIQKLAQKDCLAVVGGQQTGLFAGPLYTIYKALTTIKLARQLSEKLSVPVLPVFYLVSEDHDFAEVQWAGIVDSHNRFKRLVYEPDALPERTPVSEIVLDASISTLLQLLEQEMPETEFKHDILHALAACYRQGQSFVHAFACWLTKMLHEYGIVLLDASDARLKPMLKPVFEKELKELVTVYAIRQTNKKLVAAGYHTQLAVQPERPAVFILRNGRHSLQRQGDVYKEMNSGHPFTIDELLANPHMLSPKAALRPIAEDTLLPTIAYVGGPSEIAYWAQLRAVYQSFRLPMPIIVPRASFTLIEPKIRRHLQRFNLSPLSLLKNPQAVKREVLKGLIPEELRVKIVETRFNIYKEWRELSAQISQFDPSLIRFIEKTENNLNKQIQAIEQKLIRSVQEREKTVTEQMKAVMDNLLPQGQLQERSLNVVPFLIKYDWAFVQKLYHAVDPKVFHHQILEL